METQRKFWTTSHKAITTETIKEMEEQLNEFSKNKFVVATQLFQNNGYWAAMVYFKVLCGDSNANQ